MDMEWLTPEEAGAQWGIKARRVQALCSSGTIINAVRKGRIWLIPKNTPKPVDGRTKAAKQLCKVAESQVTYIRGEKG
jgi:hypothetical protein